MNLPNPEPNPNDLTQVSLHQDTEVINELDGFNIQPRLSIPFDGLIDPRSVTSNSVFLVRLGDTLPGRVRAA